MAATSRDKGKVSASGPALVPAGELSGKPAIPLTRPINVAGSRDNSRIHLISRSVSKAHTLIVLTRHTVFVRDLCSREGTLINGERVVERDLSDGDILKIGRFEFIFTAGGAKLRPQREKQPPPGVVRAIGSDLPPAPLESRVAVIGRKPQADVPFTETTVSAAHAVIVAWEGRRYIRDLGSRTGTFVNGKQIHQQEIHPLDQIKIGDTDLSYEISTPGEEGVEIVVEPSESAVAKAVAAQELVEVAGGKEDTLGPEQTPHVSEPESREVRGSAAARSSEDTVAAAKAEDVMGALPLADAKRETSVESADDLLSRRGWHRPAGAGDESATAEEATPEVEPVAESEPVAPVELTMPVQPPPVARRAPADPFDALIDQAIVEETAKAQGPLPMPEEAPPAPIELSSADAHGEIHATTDHASIEIDEAAAAAEAAMTTAETTVAAEASAEEALRPVAAQPAPLPLGVEEIDAGVSGLRDAVPAADAPEPVIDLAAAEKTDEIVAAAEPTPESAQPLETLAVTEDETTATANLAAAGPSPADLIDLNAADTLSDSAFAREVNAMSEPSTGEPIIVAPEVDSTESALVESESTGEGLPLRESTEAMAQAIPEPIAAPRDLELRAEPAPVADDTLASTTDRRGYVEPALPLTPPEPAAVVEDHDEAVAALEPLPPTGPALPRVPDVADPIDLKAAPPEPPIAEAKVAPVTLEAGGADEPEAAPSTQSIEDLALAEISTKSVEPAPREEPAPLSVKEPSLTAALPPETLKDVAPPPPLAVREPPTPTVEEPILEDQFKGDLLEVAPSDSAETAFAVVVPPPPRDLELTSSSTGSATETLAVAENDLPTLTEPPTAPAPASNVAHDLGPAPLLDTISTEPTISLPTGDEEEFTATIALPPPLPPDAPAVTEARDDDIPSITIPPSGPATRRPKVITDGFNRRSGRAGQEIVPEGSPFAGSRGHEDAPAVADSDVDEVGVDDVESAAIPDPFTAPPTDVFGGGATTLDDTTIPPMQLATPEGESGAPPVDESAELTLPSARRSRPRPAIPPMPTFGNRTVGSAAPAAKTTEDESEALPVADIAAPSPLEFGGTGTGAFAQPPVEGAAGPDQEELDLHERRRQRLRRIPTLFLAALLLSTIAALAIWYALPVTNHYETKLAFDNFEALTIAQRKDLQAEQLQKLKSNGVRQNALITLRKTYPAVSNGFIASPVEYDRTVLLAYWPESRPGELIIRRHGTDDEDRQRLHAVALTLYGENWLKVDETRRIRASVKELDDQVETNNRKLTSLKQQIERERLLGEQRPTATQIAELESQATQLEKTWTDSMARLKEAEAEQSRLQRALAAAKENPAPPPESDEELNKLQKELSDLQAKYEAARKSAASPQAASAREELDSAMASFAQQIESARGQGVDSPELANYIVAAENLQKTTRGLLDDIIQRQESQQRRLNDLKTALDKKAQDRTAELRHSDPQLKDMMEQRELLRRQINAGLGSDGQVQKEEIETVRARLKLVENAIKGREEVLSSDPLYVEAITSLQAIIDQTQSEIAVDRKKADEKLDELQKQFAASSPAVSNLPDEQKKLTRSIQGQMESIAQARKRYNDIVEIDRQTSDQQTKDMQARIVTLQGDVDARKKLLTEEFAERGVAAITAQLEKHAPVLASAKSTESAARGAFEEKSKALRTSRDALAASTASDDRLNRLINERQETERMLATFRDQLQFKQQESRTLIDIIQPTEDHVRVTAGKDSRWMYIAIAVGMIFVAWGVASWWTVHTANQIGFAPDSPNAAAARTPPTPQPAADGNVNGSQDHATGSGTEAEHLTAM